MGSLFGKIHSNRKEMKNSCLAALSYIRRLRAGTAKTQTANAIQELLSLRLDNTSKVAIHEFILRYKEYAPRLGDKLSAEWGLTGARSAPIL